MMKYEQDFIYKMLPNLTKEIGRLANAIERYNDIEERKMKRCPLNNEPVTYLDCQECDDKACLVDKPVDNVDNNYNKEDKNGR